LTIHFELLSAKIVALLFGRISKKKLILGNLTLFCQFHFGENSVLPAELQITNYKFQTTCNLKFIIGNPRGRKDADG
jgi:hypothetical protein